MKFVITKWLGGVVKRSLQAFLAVYGAKLATDFGVQVDPVQLTVGLMALLEALRGWLKHAKGVTIL